MNIGIIGCGSIANAHINALHKIDNINKINIFDIDFNKVIDFANKFTNVIPNKSMETVVQDSDGIIITTPNNTHLDVLKRVLSIKNIPVLCEKPLASSIDEAIEFKQIAPKFSCIGLNYRFNIIIDTLLSTITNKELGKFLFVDLSFNKNSSFTKKEITWRDQENQGYSSGAFGDLSSHLLDLVSYMTKSNIKQSSVKVAIGTKVSSRNNIKLNNDDYSIATGLTQNNVLFKVKSTKSALPDEIGFHISIICANGDLQYTSNSPQNITLIYHNSMDIINVPMCYPNIIPNPEKEIPYWADSFYFQNKAWIELISGKATSQKLANIDDGLLVQKIIDSIKVSA